MIHEKTVSVCKTGFDRVNKLLAIPSLEELTDEELRRLGANTDQCEGIFFVEFDDGSSLNYDLCSGTHNYYDDVVWTSRDGTRDIVLDCEYELDDIEFDVDGETYIVNISVDHDCSECTYYNSQQGICIPERKNLK